jgi:hypothetical protein
MTHTLRRGPRAGILRGGFNALRAGLKEDLAGADKLVYSKTLQTASSANSGSRAGLSLSSR